MTTSADLKASNLRLLILSPIAHIETPDISGGQTLSTDTTNERFASFLTSLTNVAPSRDITSFAGYTSHPPLSIRNKYYAANVSLWCDELPSPSAFTDHDTSEPNLLEWKSQMQSVEAQEVRDVIGGLVILFSFNTADSKQQNKTRMIMEYIVAVNELRDAIEDGSGRDVPAILAIQNVTPLAAADRQSAQDRDTSVDSFVQALEEACLDEHGIFGWDIVGWNADKLVNSEALTANTSMDSSQVSAQDTTKNEFGEKVGMARVLEVLEQVNWLAPVASEEASENDYDLVSTDEPFDNDTEYGMPGFKPNIRAGTQDMRDPITQQSDEFQSEIMGLHFALEEQNEHPSDVNGEAGNDMQVEQLGNLMQRVVAIREAGSEMSKADREKFARREVGKIMREMNFEN